jgi:hypothetical protein
MLGPRAPFNLLNPLEASFKLRTDSPHDEISHGKKPINVQLIEHDIQICISTAS